MPQPLFADITNCAQSAKHLQKKVEAPDHYCIYIAPAIAQYRQVHKVLIFRHDVQFMV
jgi:hypothetical protein